MQEKMPIIFIYIAIGAIVVLAAVAAWVVLTSRSADTGPQLTNETALAVLQSELFAECLPGGMPESYRSCITEVFREGEGWRVRVTYDGLYDDSVKASRVEAYIVNQDGQWLASDISEMNQCHAGRGHQDFSNELCL